MTENQLEQMRECARRLPGDETIVRITCHDGDVLEGFAVFVSDAERDVIFDLRASNNPVGYKSGQVYLITWDDIVDFKQIS